MRLLTVFPLVLAVATSAQAGSLRCDRSLVGEGTSQYEVLAKCGEPVYRQWIQEPVTRVLSTHAQVTTRTDSRTLEQDVAVQELAPLYRDVERWTYNLGHGKLLREVDFLNGKVIRIETGGRAP